MPTRWQVSTAPDRVISTLSELEIELCRQRGIDPEAATAFFDPVYERDIHDPLLLSDMAQVVDRLYAAITNQRRILVYGDYDVDGISGTAQLVTVLRRLGANVVPFIPHRLAEGYGLQLPVLETLAAEADLFITVDCGISNLEEIAWLKRHGKEVIVLDHHSFSESGQLPEADAIVHPRHPQQPYTFPWLAAAGVVWKVCQALLRDPRSPWHGEPDEEKWLLDLAALGTISDMVPLVGENRLIVRWGLQVLAHTRRPGLTALLKKARISSTDIDTELLSWRLIPQLNAPGKMDHAQPALDLLLSTDEVQVARTLAELEAINQQRQTQTTRVMKEAEAGLQLSDQPFIFAANESWPAGVVGLVASRLAEKFSRPAIIVGGNGRHAVGSARSPVSVNVLDVLRLGEEHYLKFGGHARAAGFSLLAQNVPKLEQTLRERIGPGLTAGTEEVKNADATVGCELLNWATLQSLERFAPYGEGNRQPRFVVRRLPLISVRPVGKKQEHAKYNFMVGGQLVEGIGFGLAAAVPAEAKEVDVLFHLSANSFNGQRRLQLHVHDIYESNTIH